MEVLDNAIKTRKGNKRYVSWGGRNKTVFVHNAMIIYVENPKELTQKTSWN